MKLKPLNNNVILEPSLSQMRGGIFIPEYLVGHTSSCKVIEVGNKCKVPIKPGDTVLCQNGFGDRYNNIIDEKKRFLCKDHNIFALFKFGKIMCFGQRLLIKRDKYLSVTEGGIEIPETRRTQSLAGTVIGFGVSRKPIDEVKIGDKVILKEWQPHMTEVQLSDGGYGLIINVEDVLFVPAIGSQVFHQNQVYQF